MKYFFLILACIMPLQAMSACRNAAIKRQFDKAHGYSRGRTGYVVDHICALANGGIDDVKNLQYQTISEARIKDKIENTPAGKSKYCTPENSTPTREVFNCK